jgi:hypothetical protein
LQAQKKTQHGFEFFGFSNGDMIQVGQENQYGFLHTSWQWREFTLFLYVLVIIIKSCHDATTIEYCNC